MAIERAMQKILLILAVIAIAAPAWGDAPGESGRLPEVSTIGAADADDGETDALSDMLRSEELSLGLIAGALALALFLGAAHGLEPGHGKTIVAAYLVGSRGTVGNALFLGGWSPSRIPSASFYWAWWRSLPLSTSFPNKSSPISAQRPVS